MSRNTHNAVEHSEKNFEQALSFVLFDTPIVTIAIFCDDYFVHQGNFFFFFLENVSFSLSVFCFWMEAKVLLILRDNIIINAIVYVQLFFRYIFYLILYEISYLYFSTNRYLLQRIIQN